MVKKISNQRELFNVVYNYIFELKQEGEFVQKIPQIIFPFYNFNESFILKHCHECFRSVYNLYALTAFLFVYSHEKYLSCDGDPGVIPGNKTSDDCNFMLTDLNPYSQYNISVWANTAGGSGYQSNITYTEITQSEGMKLFNQDIYCMAVHSTEDNLRNPCTDIYNQLHLSIKVKGMVAHEPSAGAPSGPYGSRENVSIPLSYSEIPFKLSRNQFISYTLK